MSLLYRLLHESELGYSQQSICFAKSGRDVPIDADASVLEMAEQEGIPIRYSCRVSACGACGACKVLKRVGDRVCGFCDRGFYFRDCRYSFCGRVFYFSDRVCGFCLRCCDCSGRRHSFCDRGFYFRGCRYSFCGRGFYFSDRVCGFCDRGFCAALLLDAAGVFLT